eukprot:SAG31_NODE_2299_length_5981_cov_2.649439_2_plen_213_part_00
MLLVLAVLSCMTAAARAHCVLARPAACFHDDPQNRVLPYPSRRPAPHRDLTRQTCMQLCADAGYVLAGAEDGGQCFCGNATAPGAQPASTGACDMPCRGNSSEACGGNDHISILEFRCAGPPDPSPGPRPVPPPPPAPPLPPPMPPPAGALNVLSIMVDDLRPQLGVRAVTFSFLCPLLEKYGTFIARCNALIEKVSSFSASISLSAAGRRW